VASEACSSEYAEVRSVLSSPSTACREMLRGTQCNSKLGMALDGLRGCSSEHAEVRSVLKALAPHDREML